MKNQQPDFQELSRQLRCPSGDNTTDMAENMFQSNANMIQQTIERITLKNNTTVLEIGFANGKHLPKLIYLAENINYHGVEISPAMLEEAKQNNHQLIEKQADCIDFSLVDEHQPLPFKPNNFDVCFTVNTLYFWQDPQAYVHEIYQLLKSDGQFVITFINKDFSEKLPLDRDIFSLYEAEEVAEWLQVAGFNHVTINGFEELTTSKFGGEHLRPCSIVSGTK